jgi:signal transduction histidine kinase
VLRHEAERRGIALEAVLEKDGMIVAAGREALSDIFSNLLINALEAAERGGHVALRLSRSEKNALLSVEDDGPGISPAARERILQPFFTTKTQGTGLGLAIVARRVAESGGRLEWDSPVAGGRGTSFRVWLPMMERANEEMK